jgi:phage gp16-like protein
MIMTETMERRRRLKARERTAVKLGLTVEEVLAKQQVLEQAIIEFLRTIDYRHNDGTLAGAGSHAAHMLREMFDPVIVAEETVVREEIRAIKMADTKYRYGIADDDPSP